ncbi:MAG: asparagine synthase (glutamine-hydrolyzing) [Parvibaculaceae bacterium]|nr:asparagine synthase (glutamine-hydrolyzing) [Parvibaculaceae bacterium]
MCGVAGIVHWGTLSDGPQVVRKMNARLHHRGPDDTGYWNNEKVSFAFSRLSIVDLDHGHQPMVSDEAKIVLVYNGEIYNHVELREELQRRGHRFQTSHSDTEVLIHGYREWGEGLLSRLNGMFAFVLYDLCRDEVFMARDRYGIKPLYLHTTAHGETFFASELEALFTDGVLRREVDPCAVKEYFSVQDNWQQRTPYKNTFSLRPGSYRRYSARGCTEGTFWDVEFPRRSRLAPTEAAEKHLDIMTRALKRQTAADVSVASYLSGGIDSTAISVLARRYIPDLKTYSCIFDLTDVGADKIRDERFFSRLAADACELNRTEIELSRDSLMETLDSTLIALGYPHMGPSYENYSIAGVVAGDGHKVVLSGLGGDEFFAGYIYRYQQTERSPLRRNQREWKTRLLRWFGRNPSRERWRATIYQIMNFPIATSMTTQVFSPDFLEASKDYDVCCAIDEIIDACPSRDPWDILMYLDIKTYLHGLLTLEDSLSMVHGLETRVPLLDNELVDFALDQPWSNLFDGETGKIVFREAMRGAMPEAIRTKPKMGFAPPDESWYRGVIKDWILERLSPDRVKEAGVFSPDTVKMALDEHFNGRQNHQNLIWSLLSFESWRRHHGVSF